jgi:hypothetical protein
VCEVISKVLNILSKHHIEMPFYQGGKYNGKDHFSQLQASITTAMTLWQGLGMSVAAKPHEMEDHLLEQIRKFKGIGDLCVDFVEKSHQDRIIDNARTKTH